MSQRCTRNTWGKLAFYYRLTLVFILQKQCTLRRQVQLKLRTKRVWRMLKRNLRNYVRSMVMNTHWSNRKCGLSIFAWESMILLMKHLLEGSLASKHSCTYLIIHKKRQCLSIRNVSPIEKVSIRSELLDQLAKWHKLNENGAVTKEEYEELKISILTDIKQL